MYLYAAKLEVHGTLDEEQLDELVDDAQNLLEPVYDELRRLWPTLNFRLDS